MRLLIISDMAHYVQDDRVFGWGPTVQEIDRLAKYFEEIRHVACLHEGPPPSSALPYSSSRVSLVPVPPSGGPRLRNKLGILAKAPAYLKKLVRELPRAHVVHVRCPSHIGLMTIVALSLLRHPPVRWVKYAGNWQPRHRENLSYAFQHWWLHRNLHRGLVTINGSWPGQRPHEITFPNPCLTQAELRAARDAALKKSLEPPFRCLFVGRLELQKGAAVVVEAVRRLRRMGLPAEADLVGDGPQADAIRAQSRDLCDQNVVRFHGWVSRRELPRLFRSAHFIALPTSCSEGWPKVLSEGMAYGAVPIATAISSIPHYLRPRENSWLLNRPCEEDLAGAMEWFIGNPDRWLSCKNQALESANAFTYGRYLEKVRRIIPVI